MNLNILKILTKTIYCIYHKPKKAPQEMLDDGDINK